MITIQKIVSKSSKKYLWGLSGKNEKDFGLSLLEWMPFVLLLLSPREMMSLSSLGNEQKPLR
jgi:hypothetical protein